MSISEVAGWDSAQLNHRIMKAEINNFNGLWYKLYRADSDVFVVVIPGSGEWIATKTPTEAQVSAVADKMGYGKYAARGKEYPFNVLTVVPPRGKSQADHAPIMAHLAELTKSLGAKKTYISGLSQGGQTVAGFLTNSQNGTSPTKYLNSDAFDGFVIFCGKAPGSPDYCANPDKPVLILHGTRDDAVGYASGEKIERMTNKCPRRTSRTILIPIPGGGHSSAWNEGYNVDSPYGKIVYETLLHWIGKDENHAIECTALLDEKNLKATFKLPEGDKVYGLVPD